MKNQYLIGGAVVLTLIAGALLFAARAPKAPVEIQQVATTTQEVATTSPMKTTTDSSPAVKTVAKSGLTKAPELSGIGGYINTAGKPIKISELRGKKVVLVDVWTYSCINCVYTLPFLKDWYQKYSDKGLEIIGVHTPQFSFEKVLSNVQGAVAAQGIKYPVVLDNDHKTWDAFSNQYWPQKYLIDIDGYIVYQHAGGGDFEETEAAIQKALAERATRLGLSITTALPASSIPGAVTEDDLRKVQSPESYFGAERNDRFGNGILWLEGEQTVTIPDTLKQNAFYLSGTWDIVPEYAANKTPGAQIKYVYSAKSVYFVAGASPPAGGAVKIRVTRDGGKSLGAAAGDDVNASGEVTIQKSGLYNLVKDSSYGAHTLEIQIEGVGLKAYIFTFG